ncbi:adenylate/guanylate cyclase domain-containing protein [Sedimentitalea nanhaiensis]|uniref:Adenylate cyclase, class 3 n=1 Tax=Sedimentitalea nanhaiensis TaxID=999627 RepID=A0A1I6YW59_9RHOB|nr:adenylate/guanylate cyclase domain-containing protein [Sedimentitalea nanhaiensis]SFT54528.1 Adenylate cyclase, class 3 [Sedimentitalea nanhaiensis]
MPHASVLISDITGSTQLYETESNQAALEQVSKVLARMRQIIENTGGKCVKSQGDDVLSFFRTSDESFQAAWAMINESWPAGLSVHVGIYFGEILNHENDIYGSAVNTAARLTSLAKPGEVLVGDQSFDDLKPDSKARLQMIGEIQLRGKARSTRVYSCSVTEMSEQTVIFAKPAQERSGGTEYAEFSLGDKTWQIGEGNTLTIGRSAECDIVLSQPWVSRKHAALSVRRWQVEFTDHSSSGSVIRIANGTEVLLHRRTTLLNGAGVIYPGPRTHLDESACIRFAIHELALMEAAK